MNYLPSLDQQYELLLRQLVLMRVSCNCSIEKTIRLDECQVLLGCAWTI
jgi:hypothetical protein